MFINIYFNESSLCAVWQSAILLDLMNCTDFSRVQLLEGVYMQSAKSRQEEGENVYKGRKKKEKYYDIEGIKRGTVRREKPVWCIHLRLGSRPRSFSFFFSSYFSAGNHYTEEFSRPWTTREDELLTNDAFFRPRNLPSRLHEYFAISILDSQHMNILSL